MSADRNFCSPNLSPCRKVVTHLLRRNVRFILFKHRWSETSLQEKDEAKKRRIDDAIARCEVPKSLMDFKRNGGIASKSRWNQSHFQKYKSLGRSWWLHNLHLHLVTFLRWPGPNPSRFLGAKTSGRCGAWFWATLQETKTQQRYEQEQGRRWHALSPFLRQKKGYREPSWIFLVGSCMADRKRTVVRYLVWQQLFIWHLAIKFVTSSEILWS